MTQVVTSKPTRIKRFLSRQWKDNKVFVVFMMLMFVFRSAIADWNDVPTGSMKPTILEGDRLWINKTAYDLHLPFTSFSLLRHSDPARGDIVIFESEKSGKRLVKRVIGVPGDQVAMLNNRLAINGEALSYDSLSDLGQEEDKLENLLGIEYKVRVKKFGGGLSTFQPVVVPDGQYLVLGDNRDNSADSRVIGYVPRDEIIGRSRHVVLSLNYDNYYLPRPSRFLHTL